MKVTGRKLKQVSLYPTSIEEAIDGLLKAIQKPKNKRKIPKFKRHARDLRGELNRMSEKEPSWLLLVPPKCCEKCGRSYSKENFGKRSVDAEEMELIVPEYCTWCKECDSRFMDEGEEV